MKKSKMVQLTLLGAALTVVQQESFAQIDLLKRQAELQKEKEAQQRIADSLQQLEEQNNREDRTRRSVITTYPHTYELNRRTTPTTTPTTKTITTGGFRTTRKAQSSSSS